jgi:hypothetical protein
LPTEDGARTPTTTPSTTTTTTSRAPSFSSPTSNVRTALDQLTQCLHDADLQRDDEEEGEVPRHVISKLLRAVAVEEFVGERGLNILRRIFTALQGLIEKGQSTTLVELSGLQGTWSVKCVLWYMLVVLVVQLGVLVDVHKDIERGVLNLILAMFVIFFLACVTDHYARFLFNDVIQCWWPCRRKPTPGNNTRCAARRWRWRVP